MLRRVTLFAVTLMLCLPPGDADARRKKKRRSKTPEQYVYLDGTKERVFWNDGDSFRVLRGNRKGTKVRLSGYNTLESYGPVHFWGAFHGWKLYDLAKDGTKLARATVWDCRSLGPKDGYGRLLVECAELTKAILKAGFAHVMAINADANPVHLKIQAKAQADRRGIWKWGIPARIVTSIHSTDENKDNPKYKGTAYNRVVDTRTGGSWTIKHTVAFKPCDAWCNGGSCMVYVPFQVRFGKKRPVCAKKGRDNRMVANPSALGYPFKDKW